MRKLYTITAGGLLTLGLTACNGSATVPPVTHTVTTPGPTQTVVVTGPTTTKTIVPKPKVVVKTVTVKVTPKPVQKVSRSENRVPLKTNTVKKGTSNHVPPSGAAACIRKYESGGSYTAQNPTSSASGAYQFLDSTWRSTTGLPGRAKDYSPAVQDKAFNKLWAGGSGSGHWVTAHKCGY